MEQKNQSEFIVVKFRKDLVPAIYTNREVFTIYDENNARIFGKNLEIRAKFLQLKSMIFKDCLQNDSETSEDSLELMDKFFSKLWELMNQ